MPKVSVVVPAYNAEDYLARCLDSLVGQTLADIEVLIVDDGSTDRTRAIADDYVTRHPDIVKALTKPNGGLSSARNYGVEHSSGQYIGFVDADDYVENEMFEHLYRLCVENDCEISICQYTHHDLTGKNPTTGGAFPFPEGKIFGPNGFLLNSHVMVVWNKIYRRDLIEKHPQPTTWFEDVAWSPVIISHAKRICSTPTIYYHYLRREGSIASSHRDLRTLQGIESVRHALDNCNPDYLPAVRYMAAQRLLFEARVRPIFAERYMQALHRWREEILESRYVLNDVKLSSRIARYVDPRFLSIPNRIISSAGHDTTPAESRRMHTWHSHLTAPDTTFVEIDGSDLSDDPVAARLRADGRMDVLADYLRLAYVVDHGGVALTPNLSGSRPLGWALHTSSAFFAFQDDEHISKDIFAATAHHPHMIGVRANFIDFIDSEDPLQKALDLYLFKQGARWDYDTVERNFGSRFQTLMDDTRIYAAGIFVQDFGFDISTTYRFPREVENDASSLIITPFYQRTQPQFAADHARWSSRRRSSATKTEVRTVNRPSRLAIENFTTAIGEQPHIRGIARRTTALWKAGVQGLTRRSAAAKRQQSSKRPKARNGAYSPSELAALQVYLNTLQDTPIRDDLVVLESFYGRGLISNPMAVFTAWEERADFENFQFVWVLDDYDQHEETREALSAKFANVNFVERLSGDYYLALATARYLINDVSFPFPFIKRAGQIYVNTWHSVTIKSLGYDLPASPLDQKNVVRNFLACDYIVAPNSFMEGIFLDSHRMRGLLPAELFVAGHPRNDLTLSTEPSEVQAMFDRLGLRYDPTKKTIVYAPTWRGSKISDPSDDISAYRRVVEEIQHSEWGRGYNVLLRPHQLAYAKAAKDPGLRDILVPPSIDANAMFTVTDILVTDYSSICFDFLVTGRPIFFYVPDEQEYSAERGLYFLREELPGPVLTDLGALVKEIGYVDGGLDSHHDQRLQIREQLLPRDDGHASERLLAAVLDGKRDGSIKVPERVSRRVLICAGSLVYSHQVQAVEAIVSWLKVGSAEPLDISVFASDFGRHKRQGAHVRRLLSQGIRPLARSKGHMVLSDSARMLIDDLPQSLESQDMIALIQDELGLEWNRCFQQASFDVVIFAGKSTSPLESLILTRAPDAHRILCTADALLLKNVGGLYDVVFEKRADLARYLNDGGFWR